MAQALTRAQTELATIETTKAEVEASLERLNREIADLLPAELAGGADEVLELRRDAEAALAAVDARVVDIRSAVTRAHTDVARVEGERRGLPTSPISVRHTRPFGLDTRPLQKG